MRADSSVSETRDAILRHEEADVMMLVDVTGGHRLIPVYFSAEIEWSRATEASVILRKTAGCVIQDFATHNDFYGLATSIGEQTEFAIRDASEMGLGPDTSLEMVVMVKVIDTAALPEPGEPGLRGHRRIRSIPNSWQRRDDESFGRYLAAKGTSDQVDILIGFDDFMPKTQSFVAWSSRASVEQNQAYVDRLEQAILEGLPDGAKAAVRDKLNEVRATIEGQFAAIPSR